MNDQLKNNMLQINTFKVGQGLIITLIVLVLGGSRVKGQQLGQRASTDKKVGGGTLNGSIADAKTGEVLVGVSIWAPYLKKGTNTNNYGYYSLSLGVDTATVRFIYIGYKTIDTLINFNRNPQLIIKLEEEGQELNTVVISGNKTPKIQTRSQMGLINIPVNQISTMPRFFGEADVMKTLQTLPGIQQGSEGTSALIVRGGSPDQNLILLDEAPLYNPSHLLGIFSAFNTNALKNVDVYKGAFPARFGGRLSSVIDITTKDGNLNKIAGNASIGLIAANLTLEGPIVKDKTSFIISGRRSYHDLYIRLIEPGTVLNFSDLNAKIRHKISDKDNLYLSGYMGSDNYGSHENATDINGISNLNNIDIKWRNYSGTLRWNHILSDKLFVNSSFIISRYNFSSGQKNETTINGLASGNNYLTSSGVQDYIGKTDFTYSPNPSHYIRAGASFSYHTFTPGTTRVTQTLNGEQLKNDVKDANVNGKEIDVYVEDDWEISDKLKVNIGLHASGFQVQGKFYSSLQPRLSARYLLPGDWALKASYARMAQYLHLLSSNSISLPTDLWVPATKKVAPQQADQFGLGLSKNIFDDKIEFSVETYYKKLNHIIEYKEGIGFISDGNRSNWEDKVTSGTGKAYGIETLFQKKEGKTTGWISYTLAWSNRSLPDINFGKTFPYKYDRRHNFNLVVVHELKPGIELSIAWMYQSASPFTIPLTSYEGLSEISPSSGSPSVELINTRNNVRIEDNHRLDAGISFIKKKKYVTRTWNFSIYNVYNRKNAFYYSVDGYNGSEANLTSNSLLPFLPSVSYNLKF